MTEDAKSPGQLERLLKAGVFVVTAETTPALTADPEAVVSRVAPLRGIADAVNVTDGAGARAHLSSAAAARFLVEAGVEPVLQFTSRDRNKLALESGLLGAAALGVPNLLCLGGDPLEKGDEPEATAVYDVDSAGLTALAAQLRDTAMLPSERKIVVPPRYFIGVADTPLDPPADWAPTGLRRKLDAGADFAQTQFCFDVDVCRRYFARLADEGITERAFFLVGIGPLSSANYARWLRDNLPGTIVPDALIARMEKAADPKREGRRICAELIQQLSEVPGVSGAHLMGPRAETEIAQAIDASGILKNRQSA